MSHAPVSPRRSFLGRMAATLAGGTLLSGATGPRKAEAAPASESPFVGEIRMFGGVTAPDGWMFCEGQLLSIAGNDTLYNLIGTTYGGDGTTTFALPDLRGRAPIHSGSGVNLGEVAGGETATVSVSQMPSHGHAALAASGVGTTDNPAGMAPARNAGGVLQYGAPDTDMTSSMTSTGGSQAHPNMQPYLGVSFIISLFGIFPSQ